MTCGSFMHEKLFDFIFAHIWFNIIVYFPLKTSFRGRPLKFIGKDIGYSKDAKNRTAKVQYVFPRLKNSLEEREDKSTAYNLTIESYSNDFY